MEVKMTYRGRGITARDIEFIQALIAGHPEQSRRALSQTLCERWDWRQANGVLRDMVCRSLMLELDRAGHIELPPVRYRPPNNVVKHRPPAVIQGAARPLRKRLEEVRSHLQFRQVRGTDDEELFNALIQSHHYLGYTRPVGEHLKYLVRIGAEPVACFAWSSAPRHLGPRDRFIGWSAPARRRNIHLLAYNTRFLILPHVVVPNLASHLLSRMVKRLSEDWERVYGHPVVYVETFVDPERFRGTCYRAANWIPLGLTTGRGKDSQSTRPNRSRKEVMGYALHKRFRRLLCGGPS
jgi:hypothetical protein